jgi:signal transduction histidine kinase/integral membrane sensor domain MASE1
MATALGIAVGNTLEALLGAWLIYRYADGLRVFERAENVFKFVFLAACLSTMVSATMGVTVLCAGGFAPWGDYWTIWLTWWLGDAASNLIIAPLLIVWGTHRVRPPTREQFVEGGALLFTVTGLGLIVFLGYTPWGDRNAPLGYVTLVPLLWAAFRFRQLGATTVAFLSSSIALWGTSQGFGPFAKPDANQSLLFLQAFIATASVTALVLAAVVADRKKAEQRLQVQHAISRALAESVTLVEATGKVIQVLCEIGDWDAGGFWQVDRSTSEISCLEFWHKPGGPVPDFEAATRASRFKPGVGLPGRVWSSGQPAWLIDVRDDPNFPRAGSATRNGLRAGICFPVKVGEQVVGAVECFSRQTRAPDSTFLLILAEIGGQLGHFIERKNAEAALEQVRAELKMRADQLESTVAERTRELQETVAELESFSYSISHDMRAPLRAMQSYASILQQELKGALSEPHWEYLTRIISASARLSNLIRDLLSYAKISRATLQLEPVDLQTLVLELIQQNPNLQPPRAEVQIAGPLPPVLGQFAALTQVCSNLLANAVKFVSPGLVPTVKVRAEVSGSRVQICIADNGIGIDAKDQERIFQLFERVNSPGAYEGTGIGLAIVRRAVERMGGQIGVRSELGKGAEFWFILPVVPGP